MNLTQYAAEAVKTAMYKDALYPYLGLVGEVGEICNKYKKVIRDDNNELSDEKRQAILDECGDVMWYIAAIARDRGLELKNLYRAISLHNNLGIKIPLLNLVNVSSRLIWEYSVDFSNDVIIYTLSDILMSLENLVKNLGSDLSTIMDNNIAKLTSRYERNVISGEGDKR